MGNHTIDCDYCGKDQRIAGDRCCADAIRAEANKTMERKNRDERNARYLSRFGLTPKGLYEGYGTRLHVDDAVDLLKYLEEKKLLVSMKGVPKKLREA